MLINIKCKLTEYVFLLFAPFKILNDFSNFYQIRLNEIIRRKFKIAISTRTDRFVFVSLKVHLKQV